MPVAGQPAKPAWVHEYVVSRTSDRFALENDSWCAHPEAGAPTAGAQLSWRIGMRFLACQTDLRMTLDSNPDVLHAPALDLPYQPGTRAVLPP
jgi:hypothetical protein